eukprot:768568-Hanusia_phi.AAC.6
MEAASDSLWSGWHSGTEVVKRCSVCSAVGMTICYKTRDYIVKRSTDNNLQQQCCRKTSTPGKFELAVELRAKVSNDGSSKVPTRILWKRSLDARKGRVG